MSRVSSPYVGPDPQSVERMFAAVAHRYDLLNHLLSLSIDRRWRRRTAMRLAELGARRGQKCLDLCTGTGDLALTLSRRLNLRVVASDFCHPMLLQSVPKIAAGRGEHPVVLTEADALQLPFPSSSFDFVTVAFGVRNMAHLEQGLSEMRRVLAPRGALVILEFSRLELPVLGALYGFYLNRMLPRIGAWISGSRAAYRYLPESVGRFPAQKPFARLIESVGFDEVDYENLSGGIAALHWGRRPV